MYIYITVTSMYPIHLEASEILGKQDDVAQNFTFAVSCYLVSVFLFFM